MKALLVLLCSWIASGNAIFAVSSPKDGPSVKGMRGKTHFAATYFNDIERSTAWSVGCDDKVTTVECSLRVQQYLFDERQKVEEKRCNLPLNRKWISLNEISRMKAIKVGPDSYLVFWVEEMRNLFLADNSETLIDYLIHFRIIDMRGCITNMFILSQSSLDLELNHIEYFLKNSIILLRDDKFDIIYAYSEKSEMLQETFNLTGHRIYGPVNHEHFDIDDQAVMISDQTGFDRSNITSRERLNFRRICGFTFPCKTNFGDGKTYALSNSLNSLTTCTKEENQKGKWSCEHQTEFGFSLFGIKFPYEPEFIMIYNIHIERLITATSKLSREGNLTVYLKLFGMNANADFELIEYARDIPQGAGKMGHFYLNSNNDICLHLSWIDHKSRDFVIRCYQKDFLMTPAVL
ncbi:hypothetical protein QAD02_018334 [Eretmocerus hayati]|uniref:Uncharacterized protein n=1 Tax=Eretmocerus hayati TaxID=131215 RepID=A0ACC2PJH2_9HYME|nr:hypothetical protein QAD02_018334 [Eretmocerus hayati]